MSIAIFFVKHFYFGSAVNGIKITGKTVDEVNKEMGANLQSYTLALRERGGKNEQLKASDIGLKYSPDGDVEILKKKQSPLLWIESVFNSRNSKLTLGITYDSKLLEDQLSKLSCFDSNNTIEPKNPSFKYTSTGYVIVDEELGNKVDKEVLRTNVEKAILQEETSIDLDAESCYVNPIYTSKSQKVIDTREILNKYAGSKITYTLGTQNEVVDGSIINSWIKVDDNYIVMLEEDKIKSYLSALSDKYSTVGKTRDFITTLGKTVKVSGGDYGWLINISKEEQDLISAIKAGLSIKKEPAYSQTALSHDSKDIGNTYVEIDMSNQHLWFYKNGTLIVQGDVVTGNVSAGHTTPAGTYKLKYKEKNAVLRGPDYAAPVTFWMPFNGGIGIHDASWRSEFGGNIYKTSGSHGCVNSPYTLAKTIYENIDAGTPVICFY